MYSGSVALGTGGLRALTPGQVLTLAGQLYVPATLAPGQYEVTGITVSKWTKLDYLNSNNINSMMI